MKRILLFTLSVLLVASQVYALEPGLIEVKDDVDDSWVYQITFPDGSVSVSGSTATVAFGSGATGLQGIEVPAPEAADDGKYLFYDHSGPSYDWGSPAGGGDMLISVWDGDTDGFIDQDAGGLDADISSYGAGLIGHTAGGAVQDTDTIAELETAIGGTNIIISTEIDSVSELNTLTSKTLTTEEDAQTIDQDWTFTTGFALGSTGDITQTTAAVDWDLYDNDANALSFDAAGKAGIINIDTQDGAEGVTMSGYLTVTGTLTQGSDVVLDASTSFTGGDIASGAYNNLQIQESGLDFTSIGNINTIGDSTSIGITAGDSYTTISNSASDDSINELFAATNTAVANILSGTTSFSGLTASANLDIGAYELRAETFESDVTTGTAPFTVASTTVVTNLNADTVDGESASAIVTAARVGAASDNLDDTDASVEWEDAAALDNTGALDAGALIGDTAFTDLDAGDTYTNFSTSADDDTLNELFAAIDTAFGAVGALSISDTAYSGDWNGVTDTAASKNAIYDQLHIYDTDDDGDIDSIDASLGSGDVLSVGNCDTGACLDGTDDGGTQILFYDADGATTLVGGNTSGAVTLTLPTTTGTIYASNNDGELDALAGLTSEADKVPYFTGSGTASVADLPAYGRTLIANESAGDARADLDLEPGTDVQTQDDHLQNIADMSSSDPGADRILFYDNGSPDVINFLTPATNVLQISGTNLTFVDHNTARSALGVEIGGVDSGSDVQAYDPFLQNIADLTDPGGDRVLFWDDASPNAIAFATVGNGIEISTTALQGVNAAADGSTKGVASFNANHFDASTGVISLDTTNGPYLLNSAADTFTGDTLTFADGDYLEFGTNNDWQISNNGSTTNQMIITTTSTGTGTTTNGMLQIVVNDGNGTLTDDQEVFEILNYTTELFSVDENGDAVLAGSMTFGPDTGTESRLDMNNNSSAPTGMTTSYSLAFVGGELNAYENGTWADFLDENDSPTWAASTTHDYTASGVTLLLPSTAGTASAVAVDNTNQQFIININGTQYKFDADSETLANGDTWVYDSVNGIFEFAAAGGGSGSNWDTIGDPDGAATVAMDSTGQTTDFAMSVDNTGWTFTYSGTHTTETDLFHINQTGTSIGTADVVGIDAADSSATPLHVAHSVASAAINTALFETTGNTASGTEIVQIKSLDADDDAIQLQLLNGTDDYANISIAESGTFTINVTSDGTAAIALSDPVTVTGALTVSGAGNDITAPDDIILNSSGATIDFSANSTSLTASAGTLTLEGNLVVALDSLVTFGAGGETISSDDANYLDLDADTGIRLNANSYWPSAGANSYSITMTNATGDNASFYSHSDGTFYIQSSDGGSDNSVIALDAYDTTENTLITMGNSDGTYVGNAWLEGTLSFDEHADITESVTAGHGYLWVKSDTPSSLIFTDDADTDYDLTALTTLGTVTTGVWNAGAVTSSSTLTATTNVVIGDAGNIGSATDGDAIAIAANGEVTFSQEIQAGAGIDASGQTIIATTFTGEASAIANDIVTMDKIDDDGDFTSLTGAWATTGTLNGAAKVTRADPDTWTMSGSNMYGGVFIATAAGTATLPAVVVGMNFTASNEGGAVLVTLDPNAADTIYLDGAAESQAEDIDNNSEANASVVCVGSAANTWSCTSYNFDGAVD